MKSKKKLIITIGCIVLAVAIVAGSLLLIFGKGTKDVFDNEVDRLVFSIQEVDKVFNPFFSTSATDSSVVGMTQIGMLGNDKVGNPTYGDNEAVVTKDLETVTEGTGDDQTTTYKFVLKNNVRFSNGSYLTIKDVLFNMYVYLDPAYTGSATMYSTDIVGLQEYRTQEADENEQDAFKQQFENTAAGRIQALIDVCNTLLEDDDNASATSEEFVALLEEYVENNDAPYFANVVEDYIKAVELFEEELNSDYSNSIDAYEDQVFTDKAGNVHKNLFTTDVEMFLYNEGYITWNKNEGRLQSSLTMENDVASLKTWTKEQAIATIIEDKIPADIEEILNYWVTATSLRDFLINQAMEQYFKDAPVAFPNISGIKFANRNDATVVNGKTYGVPLYDENGRVVEGNEVLTIKIKGVDPKAIWNFAFAVAPMYYYSDAAHIAAFDYEANFGVERGSQTFMNEVVKNPAKIGVPVGAGPYAASKSSGGLDNVTAGDFCEKGVIYYERNPHYVMGPAKIKKVCYQVVSSTAILNSLYGGEIDFAEPNAKPETIAELDAKKEDGIGNTSIKTSGYGYIGINAGKVPSINVRQVIMHCINTQECVDYYKTTASAIHRSMSATSWAYPKGCTPYYPYIGGPVPEDLTVVNPAYAQYVRSLSKKAGDVLSEEEQARFIKTMIESVGYKFNSNGIYYKGNDTLKYTFTIAGQETDHPAYMAMLHAAEILNKNGFNVNVTTDANALKKLAEGSLTVWAAAWGSTIDPDMYQVYHKDSTATSVLNWGYKQILLNAGGKYEKEVKLLNQLSTLIDQGREYTSQDARAPIYSQALDIVMQLAIELPTYQRDDLFAYNVNKIDETTFTPASELSPFKGLTSDIHMLSLVVKER